MKTPIVDLSALERVRSSIARLLCEQHGGDPDAVASEPHDCWDGPLWTQFTRDADAILNLPDLLALARRAEKAEEWVRELEAGISALIPSNVSLDNAVWPDGTIVPVDFTLGELRAARNLIAPASGGENR